MSRPVAMSGMHHVALNVIHLEQCEKFYTDLLGMKVEWRPDSENVYLCSGNDNLALHRLPANQKPEGIQRLNHIGFILKQPDLVDDWYNYLNSHNVKMKSIPETHRDGARSFYCEDPEGNLVQIIYHPPLEHL
jgi:catechol 2,3-dioxygenase-like lactoylglutathione lyase family enzyme